MQTPGNALLWGIPTLVYWLGQESLPLNHVARETHLDSKSRLCSVRDRPYTGTIGTCRRVPYQISWLVKLRLLYIACRESLTAMVSLISIGGFGTGATLVLEARNGREQNSSGIARAAHWQDYICGLLCHQRNKEGLPYSNEESK